MIVLDTIQLSRNLMAKFQFTQWLVDFLKADIFEFEWDDGNSTKNLDKHDISTMEAEEVFYSKNILPLGLQYQPEVNEERHAFLSETATGKKIFTCFTVRNKRVRVINIRAMSKAERFHYDKIC
jgi:uncharacterized protein